MSRRNRGHRVIGELRDRFGVQVNLGEDRHSIVLTALDTRGVSFEAERLARAFKPEIRNELQRRAGS